jgi:glycosyltransferase involved in cell wall biosynthesis
MSKSLQSQFDKHKCCVLIATYNNAATLGKVISDVLEYTTNVIIVNDGCTDNTWEVLIPFREKVTLVSYPHNMGKGWHCDKDLKKLANYLLTIA